MNHDDAHLGAVPWGDVRPIRLLPMGSDGLLMEGSVVKMLLGRPYWTAWVRHDCGAMTPLDAPLCLHCKEAVSPARV